MNHLEYISKMLQAMWVTKITLIQVFECKKERKEKPNTNYLKNHLVFLEYLKMRYVLCWFSYFTLFLQKASLDVSRETPIIIILVLCTPLFLEEIKWGRFLEKIKGYLNISFCLVSNEPISQSKNSLNQIIQK